MIRALGIAVAPMVIAGRRERAIAKESAMPVPLPRWREGDARTLLVARPVERGAAVHWRDGLLPSRTVALPGVSFMAGVR